MVGFTNFPQSLALLLSIGRDIFDDNPCDSVDIWGENGAFDDSVDIWNDNDAFDDSVDIWDDNGAFDDSVDIWDENGAFDDSDVLDDNGSVRCQWSCFWMRLIWCFWSRGRFWVELVQKDNGRGFDGYEMTDSGMMGFEFHYHYRHVRSSLFF